MALRLSAAVPAPLEEREQELERLEQALRAEETALAQEAEGLARNMDALRQRSAELSRRAEVLEAAGGGVGEGWNELRGRLARPALPAPETEKLRERALLARRDALEARRKISEAVRQQLAAAAAQLGAASSRLEADSKALEAELAQAKKAQADARRVEQERQAPPPVAARPAAPPASAAPAPAPAPRSDGRGKPRVRIQAAVDLSSDSNFFTGFSTNMSEGGLFVATVHTLDVGTQIDLNFSIPGGQKLAVKGVVRWTREVNDKTPDIFPGVGVQFVDLSAPTAELIKQFVASREPLFFPD